MVSCPQAVAQTAAHSAVRELSGDIFFEAGQTVSCLLVANGIGLVKPGTRVCGIQAISPFVSGSGRYAEYGAVMGNLSRNYQ